MPREASLALEGCHWLRLALRSGGFHGDSALFLMLSVPAACFILLSEKPYLPSQLLGPK